MHRIAYTVSLVKILWPALGIRSCMGAMVIITREYSVEHDVEHSLRELRREEGARSRAHTVIQIHGLLLALMSMRSMF